MPILRKNIGGQRIEFSLFDSDGNRVEAPTLEAGDFKIRKDGAAQTNVATLPTHDSAGVVSWLPSQAETNCTFWSLVCKDVAGDEWQPRTIFDRTDSTTSSSSSGSGTIWASAFSGTEQLTLWRGDTLALVVTGLGDLLGLDDLWFAVKRYSSDTDATAEILIGLVSGLISIAGAAAATPANGSIVIDDASAGNITINLTAGEMASIASFNGYWDIQRLDGATITTLRRGNVRILGDVTRRVA